MQVASHAIDPMVRRLITEAKLMASDDTSALGPASSRWLYIWSVARVDIAYALSTLAISVTSDSLKVICHQYFKICTSVHPQSPKGSHDAFFCLY